MMSGLPRSSSPLLSSALPALEIALRPMSLIALVIRLSLSGDNRPTLFFCLAFAAVAARFHLLISFVISRCHHNTNLSASSLYRLSPSLPPMLGACRSHCGSHKTHFIAMSLCFLCDRRVSESVDAVPSVCPFFLEVVGNVLHRG